jgi:hypothetical protein
MNLERRLRNGRPVLLGRPGAVADLSALPSGMWDGRTVSAQAVEAYCAAPGASERKRVDGVKIAGPLDLSSLRAENRSIEFSNCYITGAVRFDESLVHKIDLSSSFLAQGVSATNARVNVFLIRSAIAAGRVDLRYAEIDGPCELTDSIFRAASPESLDLRGATIKRSLLLMRAQIRGGLVGSGLTVQDLLDGTDMIIDGADWVPGEPDAYGEPRRPLEARHIAMLLDFASVAGPVRLRATNPGGFRASGLIRMLGCRIGYLSCDGAELRNPHAVCLNLERAVVTNSVHLRHDFKAHGSVSLFAAEIGDALELTGATFEAPESVALGAERARIAGPILLRDVKMAGLARFLNSEAGSFVECTGCSFRKAERPGDDSGTPELPAEDMALSFESATIAGKLILGPDFSALGRVVLSHARIQGDLVVDGKDPEHRVHLANDGTALQAFGLAVQRAIVWHHVETAGFVDMRHASCAILEDDVASWPARTVSAARPPGAGLPYAELNYRSAGRGILRRPASYGSGLVLDGFVYQGLAGRDVDWKSRKAIFDKAVDWNKPQPYLQLADVYRRQGSVNESRKVQIARLNAAYHPLSPWRWVLQGLIGYGYRPLRSVIFLAIMGLLAGFAFSAAGHHDGFVPAEYPHPPGVTSRVCRPSVYPCFRAYAYSADSILPVLNLRQRQYWAPDFVKNPWIGYWAWALGAIGWIIGLLVVAGFTNLVRQE